MLSDDQNTSSTWPSALPAGWTMEWEPSTSYGSDDDVMFGLIMTSPLRRLYIVVFYFPLQDLFLIVCFYEAFSFGTKL